MTVHPPNSKPYYTEIKLIEEIDGLRDSVYTIPNPDKIKSLLKISSECNYTSATIKAYCLLGYFYVFKSDYETGRALFNKGLILLKSSDILLSLQKEGKQKLNMELEGGIATTYSYEGNIDLALPHYYNALQISKKLGLSRSSSNFTSNIGTIYYMNEDIDRALIYYGRAKDLKFEMQTDKGLDVLYNNIAGCYINLKKYEKAFVYLRKAIEVTGRTKNKTAISFVYTNYSELYLANHEYEQALEYAEESIIISKEIENWDSLMRAYLAKAHILERKGRYAEGVKFTHESLKVAKEFNFKVGLSNAYQFLGKLYELVGDFENSCCYLKKYLVVREEVNSDKTNKTIAILNAGYESERKDSEIKQLHQQQKMLESKNEELKLFATKASHDMREPLRMISSYSSLVKRKYKVNLDEDAVLFLDTIEDASIRMNRLLSDLLNYTLTGINKSAKEMVCLNRICDNVQANLQLVIHEKSAFIEVDKLPTIDGYQSDMTQLFQNLISNALKFCTQKVPHIRVEAKELDGEWQIAVHDNGIGIREEDKTRIFDLLTRLHSKQEFKGTGIGLATCKKIVEQYKGEIWVESELGLGTSFFFTLPTQMSTIYDL